MSTTYPTVWQTRVKTMKRRILTPPIHTLMIHCSVLITSLAGVAFFYSPPEKESFFQTLALTGAGFLFGKFTNGFGGRTADENQNSGRN